MKTSEMADLTNEELEQLYRDSRRELFNLRMQKTTGQLDNPSRLRLARREYARVLTFKNQRKETA